MKQLIQFVFLLVTPNWSLLPSDFGPFAPGTEPRLHHVTELKHQHSYSFGATEFSAPLVEFLRGENELSWSLVVNDQSGNAVAGPVRVSSFMTPNRAYVADINQDKQPDYIIEAFSGGNGIPPSDVVFAVSSGAQYVITVFRSYSANIDDFVDLLGNGGFQYIQSMFVFGSDITGKDGKSHNYWVYNIYSLEGSTFTMRNAMKTGFPKWIMHAGRVNHRSTEQLTEEQKNQLWKAREACLIWPAGDACASR
jgi:hypothetical protein